MNRFDVTEVIVAARIAKGLKWADIAKGVGQSKEWTTAALLGQMPLTEKQAETIGRLFRHWANELKPDAGLSRRRRNLTAVETKRGERTLSQGSPKTQEGTEQSS